MSVNIPNTEDLSAEIKSKHTVKRNTFHRKAKEDKADNINIEIGDSKQDDFYPQFKLTRWDNEGNFSVRYIDEYENAEVITDKEKIIWRKKNNGLEIHFYEIEDNPNCPEGGTEMEVVLLKKPESNIFEFSINNKDFDFIYQPPYDEQNNPEDEARVVTKTETTGYDKDGKVVAHTPEHVIKSYVVASHSHINGGNYSLGGGKNYRYGKVGNIYRPKVKDSNGNECWAELFIDSPHARNHPTPNTITEGLGKMTITVPQKFLDKAVYPVFIDPTFGQTGTGDAEFDLGGDSYIGHYGNPGGSCNIQSLTAAIGDDWLSGTDVKGALYSTAGVLDSGSETVVLDTGTATPAEFTFTITGGFIGSNRVYVIPFQADASVFSVSLRRYADTGTNSYFENTGVPWGTWVTPVTWERSGNRYCTYATYADIRTETIQAKASVKKTFSTSISAKAIIGVATQTIQAKADIKIVNAERVLQAKASIRITDLTKTIQGKANIVKAGRNWLAGWAKRIEVSVVSSGRIDANQTHFPLLLKLGTSVGINNDDISAIFDEVGANSQKIAITKSDGSTEIYAEIISWDNGSETAFLFVSKSDLILSNSANTKLYFYFDNTHADNTTYIGTTIGSSPATNVWDNNFVSVWHFQETTGDYKDSTGNHDILDANITITSRAGNGKIGPNAPEFDGINDFLEVAHHADFSLINYTLEITCEPDVVDDWRTIIAKGISGTFNYYTVFDVDVLINRNGWTGTDEVESSTTFTTEWTNLVTICDDTKEEMRLYKNGAEVSYAQQDWGGSANTNTDDVQIGQNDEWGEFFDGVMNEIRISNIVRTDAYLKANSHSLNDNLVTWSDVTTQTDIQAKANIRATQSTTIQAKSRIQVGGVTHTIQAKARIEKTEIYTIQTKARIQVGGVTQSIQTKANIKAVQTTQIQAKSRVQVGGVAKNIQTKANIRATQITTIQAKANIKIINVECTLQTRAKLTGGSLWSIGYAQGIATTATTQTNTIQAKAHITLVYIETIQVKANLKITTNQTIQAKARIQTGGVVHTIQAKARTQRTESFNIEAKARIQRTEILTIQAKANIKATSSINILAKANIKVTTQTNIQSKARIQTGGVGKNIQAKANIKKIQEVTIQAKTSIALTSFSIILAKANVKGSITESIQVKARIQIGGVIQSIQAKANIKAVQTTSINTKARIEQLSSTNIQTKGRVLKGGVGKTIQTKADIKLLAISTTIEAKARIEKTVTDTIQAKAQIRITGNPYINVKADIKKTTDKTLEAKGAILRTETTTIQAKGNIHFVWISPISAKANIRQAVSVSLEAKARIQIAGISTTISAKGRIERTESSLILAKARIEKTESYNIDAQARIEKTGSLTIQTKGNIRATQIVQIQTKARILIAGVTFIIQAKGDIKLATSNLIDAKARIEILGGIYISAIANIKRTQFSEVATKARIERTEPYIIDAKARIELTSSVDIQAKGRIQVGGVSYNINTKANIKKTQSSDAQAKGNIKAVISNTIEAKGRIEYLGEIFIQSKASIKIFGVQTNIQAKGNIRLTTGRELLVKARIQKTELHNIDAIANIKVTTIQTIDAKASIFKELPGIFILALARIEKTESFNIEAKADILKEHISLISSKARIEKTEIISIEAKASIFIELPGITISAKANIQKPSIIVTIQAKARIKLTSSVSILTKAHIHGILVRPLGIKRRFLNTTIMIKRKTVAKDAIGDLTDSWNNIHDQIPATIQQLTGDEIASMQGKLYNSTHRGFAPKAVINGGNITYIDIREGDIIEDEEENIDYRVKLVENLKQANKNVNGTKYHHYELILEKLNDTRYVS